MVTYGYIWQVFTCHKGKSRMIFQELLPFEDLIKKFAVEFSLDPNLIKAFILTESGADPFRNRLEISYWKNNRYCRPELYAAKLGITSDTEKVNQSMSWGLMQIMGVVAREVGYKDHLTKLCEPEIGLRISLTKFKLIQNKYPILEDSISAWNAGTPHKLFGYYSNQSYVTKVKGYMSQLPSS